MKPRSRPARPRARDRDIKPIPPVGPAGDTNVRPIRGKGTGDYDTGVPPIKRDPWRDEGEGEPQTNG